MSNGTAHSESASRNTVVDEQSKGTMDVFKVLPRSLLENPVPESILIEMNRSLGAPPVFIVHPIEGHVKALFEMAEHLSVPAIGVQRARGIPVQCVEDLAATYLKAIRKRNFRGPFHLVGYSFGAAVAFEMAVQLQASGASLGSLTFLDGSPRYVTTVMTPTCGALKENDDDEDSTLLCMYVMQFLDENFAKVRDRIKQHQDLEAKKEAAVDMILECSPGPQAPRENVAAAVSTFLELRKAGVKYRPKTKFHGNITLIKASMPLISGRHLPPDYGSSECCDGKVCIKVVDGSHESFLQESSAHECASIISHLVQHGN
uniref:oleoyl-[acyl-carrier-protein] hydrolase n=1 Tax=Amblyomma triste TaxID=251400 RepID=A0A023GBB7_AMBTT